VRDRAGLVVDRSQGIAGLDRRRVPASNEGHAVELVGRATVGGRETWKLKVAPKGGTPRHV
jgi:hypothetical protein